MEICFFKDTDFEIEIEMVRTIENKNYLQKFQQNNFSNTLGFTNLKFE